MRTLTFIIAPLFFSVLAQAQEQEKSYENIIYLGLPSYLYKPSNSEITDFIKNRPELTIPLPFKNLIFYTSGETLIRIVAFKGTVKSTYLEGQKEFFDYMNAQGTGTTTIVQK